MRPRRRADPPPQDVVDPPAIIGRSNVLDPQRYPAWDEWPTLVGVAALLKVSAAQAQQIYMRGELARWECPDQTYRFDPAQVANYQSLSQLVEQQAVPTTDQTPDIVKEAQKQAIELLKQSHAFIEKLLTLVPATIDKSFNSLTAQAERMQKDLEGRDKYAGDLHAKIVEGQRLRETMLDRSTEREILKARAEHEQKRKDSAWKQVQDSLPTVVKAIELTIVGRDPDTKARISDLLGLLHGPDAIQAEVLEGLLQMDGILTDKQKAMLRRAIKPPKPGEGLNGEAKSASTPEKETQDHGSTEP